MSEIIQPSRRNFLRLGLAALAAPAIVRATSLMPIKAFEPELQQFVVTAIENRGNLLAIDKITREAVKLWQESNVFLSGMPGLQVGDIITIQGVEA